jgi:hypothetical protein
MILSRQRPAASDTKKARASEEAPTLETFLDRRDYRGAITLLEFNVQAGLAERFVVLPWLAYSYFHLGDHKKVHRLFTRAHSFFSSLFFFLFSLFFQLLFYFKLLCVRKIINLFSPLF